MLNALTGLGEEVRNCTNRFQEIKTRLCQVEEFISAKNQCSPIPKIQVIIFKFDILALEREHLLSFIRYSFIPEIQESVQNLNVLSNFEI